MVPVIVPDSPFSCIMQSASIQIPRVAGEHIERCGSLSQSPVYQSNAGRFRVDATRRSSPPRRRRTRTARSSGGRQQESGIQVGSDESSSVQVHILFWESPSILGLASGRDITVRAIRSPVENQEILGWGLRADLSLIPARPSTLGGSSFCTMVRQLSEYGRLPTPYFNCK